MQKPQFVAFHFDGWSENRRPIAAGYDREEVREAGIERGKKLGGATCVEQSLTPLPEDKFDAFRAKLDRFFIRPSGR